MLLTRILYCFCFVCLFVLSTRSALGQRKGWNEDSSQIVLHIYEDPGRASELCTSWLKSTKKGTRKYAWLKARLGLAYDLQGVSDKAAENFLEAIDIQRKNKDSAELSFSYNNLGICYFYQYRYNDAILNYRKSARIDSLMNDLQGWSGTMLNIAIIYSNQNKTDQALRVYENILRMMHEINDHSLDAAIYSNSAKLYVLAGKYGEALRRIDKIREQVLRESDPSPKMTIEVISSNSYLGLNRFDEAITAAKRGLSYDSNNSHPERRMHLYECLSHAFYANAEVDSGNYYNGLYQEYRDSLFNAETQQQLSEIQTKYGLAETQLEKARYKNKSIQSERKAIESKAQRNLFLAIAGIFLIVGLLLFIILQKRRAQRNLLNEKLHSKEMLVEQKEAFLGEIHHRVRNNLQLVSSMLAMQQVNTNDTNVSNLLEASRNRIETMSLIHERLYTQASGNAILLDEYVKQLTEQIMGAYTIKDIKISYNIEKICLHIDTLVPFALVLNELLTNSVKYAFGENDFGRIDIEIFEKNSKLVLKYTDSGDGYNSNMKEGFGSKLIASLSRQLKARREVTLDEKGFHQFFYINHYKKEIE